MILYSIAPGTPTGVSVEIINATSLQLSWQRPVDANGVILEYQVLYFGYKGNLSANIQNTQATVSHGIIG